MTRRHFSWLLAALSWAVPRRLRAAGTAPELWNGEDLPAAGPGAIMARRQDHPETAARLTRKIKPTWIRITSVVNDNSTFMLWAVFPRQPDTWQFLALDGVWWRAESMGHDGTGSQASFTFDRETAFRFAKAFKIRAHERIKLDDGLRYSWSFPETASTDTKVPIPITLRIENAGTSAVAYTIGGRDRGPRDNRFSFTVTRDGEPVTIKEGWDFGGLSTQKPLRPGDRAEVICRDLRAWAELDRPGRYAIASRYEGELAPGSGKRPAPAEAGVWDIVSVGQGTILVR